MKSEDNKSIQIYLLGVVPVITFSCDKMFNTFILKHQTHLSNLSTRKLSQVWDISWQLFLIAGLVVTSRKEQRGESVVHVLLHVVIDVDCTVLMAIFHSSVGEDKLKFQVTP